MGDKEVNAKNYGPTMHGFTPVSTILWKMIRFFIINIYYIFNSRKKKLSRLKSGKWFGQMLHPKRMELVNILSE